MGLDQYIGDTTPDLLDPFSNDYGQLSYWRKDWTLQTFLNTNNCEELELTVEICDNVLSNLGTMYIADLAGKTYTQRAFQQAKEHILANRRIIYEANW